MKTARRLIPLLALALSCGACRAPEPPPTDKPPEPQAVASASSAMQVPLQKAQAVEQQVLDGADRTRQAEAGQTVESAADAAP